MLKITIDGQSLDLEGIRFTVQLNSPFPFDPTVSLIEGSFAFGAKFPASKRNKAIFDFPHRIEKYPTGSSDYQGYLFFDGRKLFDVIISLFEVTDFYFNANIKIGIGYFSNLIQDKSLRDLELGGDISLGETTQDVIDHADAIVQKTYPEASHTFPVIYNPEFYGEENEFNAEWWFMMNYYTPGSGFPANTFDEAGVYNHYNLVPCFYLMYVLEKCFKEFGYLPSGDFMLDEELQELIIYNNRSLDLIEDRYKAIAEMSEDQNIVTEEIVLFDTILVNIDNCYDPLTKKFEIKTEGKHQFIYNLTIAHGAAYEGAPGFWGVTVYLDDVIIGGGSGQVDHMLPFDASAFANLYLSAASIGKQVYITVQFDDYYGGAATGTVYTGSSSRMQNLSESQLNRYQKTITPSDHLPDIKISEFLVRLQKLFGIVYAFDHSKKEVRILFIKNILKNFASAGYDVMAVKSSKKASFHAPGSYKLNFTWPSSDGYTKDNFLEFDSAKLIGEYSGLQDLPEVAIENTYALLLNQNAVYVYKEGTWQFFTDYYYPLSIGEGKTEIIPEVAPLLMITLFPHADIYYLYPKILQKGSSQDLGNNEFGFHLLFYRGMINNYLGNAYPFASSTIYGPVGEVLGNYELKWDGSNGLYEQFLQEYYDFVLNRSRPLEYERYFTASEIRNVDFMGKVRIFQNTFLVKQISIPISQSSIGVAKLKLIKS